MLSARNHLDLRDPANEPFCYNKERIYKLMLLYLDLQGGMFQSMIENISEANKLIKVFSINVSA